MFFSSKAGFYVAFLTFTFTELHIAEGRKRRPDRYFDENFLFVKLNSHKQRELRVAYGGILALETKAFIKSDHEMLFRQVTDGRKLVAWVIQDGEVKDCDFTKDSKSILDFVDEFITEEVLSYEEDEGDVFQAYNVSGDGVETLPTMQHFSGETLLGPFQDIVDIKSSRKLCHRLFRKAQHDARLKRKENKKIKRENKKLRKRTNRDPSVPMSHRRSKSPVSHSRSKRSLFTNWLIFPGTKWCGKGDVAVDYADLGSDVEADVCCRDHDNCPYVIESFESKFHMFNYRLHSIVYCKCDEDFRLCLKKSKSPNADFVGKIYFNIMGSKCFDLEDGDICVRRTWWGTCIQYETKMVASTRDQRGYKGL